MAWSRHLQLQRITAAAHQELMAETPFPPIWQTSHELCQATDAWLMALRARKIKVSAQRGLIANAMTRLDDVVHTQRTEWMDDPDFPAVNKLATVRYLHLANRLARTYQRIARHLTPLLEHAARRYNRPVRVLELAAGAGDCTLALATATGLRCAVQATASDIVPTYVDEARDNAAQRGIQAEFCVLDACDLSDLNPGDYDVIFAAQCLHHFSAGHLATMIAAASRIATTAFVGFDATRGLRTLAALPVGGVLSGRAHVLHDAIISARRFWSEPELAIIATIAAPDARVFSAALPPFHSTVEVWVDDSLANFPR